MRELTIRRAGSGDQDGVWAIFEPIVAAGDTYAYLPETPRPALAGIWFDPPRQTYVAEREGRIVGTYRLMPNMPGLGDHVANGSYMVHPLARGHGVGYALGAHSLVEAKSLGFRAMQFNLVVSTNKGAVRLWQRLGFAIVGTLPGAFRHTRLGYVDAYVMFRSLDDIEPG